MLGTFALMIGTGALTQSIEYQPGIGPKQIAWALHCAVLGAVVAPMCFLGGPILTRAALYTAGIVGGLSTVAVCAPSDKFLYMGGPLAVGLGLVFASSLASMWLPPTTALGAGMYKFAKFFRKKFYKTSFRFGIYVPLWWINSFWRVFTL